MVFVTPAAYADEERFHAACALLRRESPVHRVEARGFNPFWALTKHADVLEIEKLHATFLNAPRALLTPAEADARRAAEGEPLRTLIHMDEPDHKAYRGLVADWFQGAAVREPEARIAELARRAVDGMAKGDACDFVADVAAHYPLRVILSILGLPEEDFPRMLRLTRELFGTSDPEMRRGARLDDHLAVLKDFYEYFRAVTAARRESPTSDLASVIANGSIDGRPLGDLEAMSYYVIIATAGHDTTSSTIAGGLLALIQHPDQLERLRADPSLLPLAADEMIRWVSPVKHFMRTATIDHEIRGVKIPAGESVLLSYPSANRDEEVFDRPFMFDAGRNPNRHLAFGFGAHFCLGAQLARMETRALFAELLPRLEQVEPAGPPAWIETLFVGGLKRLPIRYRIT